MLKVLLKFAALVDRFIDGVGSLSSLLLIVMTVLMFAEVILRYLFNSPTIWSFQLSLLIFGSFCMLSGGYVLLKRRHIKMDLLWANLSLKKQVALDLITSVLFFLFIILLTWKLGEAALDSWRVLQHTVTSWHPPIYPYKTVLFLGALLIFLAGLSKFIRDLDLFLQLRVKQ